MSKYADKIKSRTLDSEVEIKEPVIDSYKNVLRSYLSTLSHYLLNLKDIYTQDYTPLITLEKIKTFYIDIENPLIKKDGDYSITIQLSNNEVIPETPIKYLHPMQLKVFIDYIKTQL